MNFQDAVALHQYWKFLLLTAIDINKAPELDCGLLCSGAGCDLSRWIEGDGKKYFSEIPEFLDLVASHNQFHKTAAEIVSHLKAGNISTAKKLVNTNFQSDSCNVIRCLVELYLTFVYRGQHYFSKDGELCSECSKKIQEFIQERSNLHP